MFRASSLNRVNRRFIFLSIFSASGGGENIRSGSCDAAAVERVIYIYVYLNVKHDKRYFCAPGAAVNNE